MQLFFSHRSFTHNLWKTYLKPSSVIVDATCGNGHDTLFLAESIDSTGKLFCFDIQKEAIESTRKKLLETFSEAIFEKVKLFNHSHESFNLEDSVDLFVYNLGYLPGADKSITTQVETTLKSMESALKHLSKGGLICITCYPGHEEGKLEQSALLEYFKELPKDLYTCIHHTWVNKKEDSPTVILIESNSHLTQ